MIACLKSRTMSEERSIAHHRIVSKLGEGGMGVLFLLIVGSQWTL